MMSSIRSCERFCVSAAKIAAPVSKSRPTVRMHNSLPYFGRKRRCTVSLKFIKLVATPFFCPVATDRELRKFLSTNEGTATAVTTHVLTLEEIQNLAAEEGKPAETLMHVVALI